MCKQGETALLRLRLGTRAGGEHGREVEVDACLAPLLQALNDAGIPTCESCCGHGKRQPAIYFDPGPSRLTFSTYGCCGESWIVTLEWDGSAETIGGEPIPDAQG